MTFGRRVRDASGRVVTMIDPVTMDVTNRPGPIDRALLRSIAERIAPRQRSRLVVAIATGVALALVLAAGQLAYHRLRGGWPTVDGPSLAIWIVQLGMCFTMALLVWHQGRAAMRHRALAALIEHAICPHCGYDLEGLPVEPDSGATRCPECGCVWRLDAPSSSRDAPRDATLAGPGKILAIMVGSIVLMIALIVLVIAWRT